MFRIYISNLEFQLRISISISISISIFKKLIGDKYKFHYSSKMQ